MVPKGVGQKAIQLVRGLQLFDYSLEIDQKNNSIFIPLNKKPNASILKIIEKDLPSLWKDDPAERASCYLNKSTPHIIHNEGVVAKHSSQ